MQKKSKIILKNAEKRFLASRIRSEYCEWQGLEEVVSEIQLTRFRNFHK